MHRGVRFRKDGAAGGEEGETRDKRDGQGNNTQIVEHLGRLLVTTPRLLAQYQDFAESDQNCVVQFPNSVDM